MPSPTLPDPLARTPASGFQPVRLEPKQVPFDQGPWYAGRQAWQRALESDKKR